MKAIRVHQTGEPEVMQLKQVPDPHVGPGQVLVRIHACGINPVETYIRSGRYGTLPPLPYTPGSDGAGVVESVGLGVARVRVGDRVYTAGSVTGTYAELALCSENQVYRLPERVSFAEGAGIYIPYATAYRALVFKARVVAGESVFVHGASGGVGLAAIQWARAMGLQVFGTAGTEAGLDLVRETGAHVALDHRQADYWELLKKQSGERGMDVVLEMLANVNLAKDLTAVAKGGRIIVIGNRGSIEINPREAMMRDASIIGMTLFNASEPELRAIHAAIGAGLENGTLKPVIGRRFPLAEAAQAHHAVMAPGARGKIILEL